MPSQANGIAPGVVMGAARTITNEKDQFYKLFTGEVISVFKANSITDGRLMTRSIPYGKSAEFATHGQTIGDYHVPGSELAGVDANRIQFNTRLINVDRRVVAPQWINSIDELMTHFELRGPVSSEIGYALARRNDVDRLSTIIRAARSAGLHRDRFKNVLFGGQSGAVSTVANAVSGGASENVRNAFLANANFNTNAQVLLNGIIAAKQGMAERNVPMDEIWCALRPVQYYLLLQLPSTTNGPLALNKDWAGNNGDLATGTVAQVAGVKLLMTNNFPEGDVTTNGTAQTGGNSYNGDFSNTSAVIWQSKCAGVVSLQDITTEDEYYAKNQATLMLGKYVRGSNVLQPECAAELWNSATAAADAKLLPT